MPRSPASGVKLSRTPKPADIEAILTRRTDGAYAELTRETTRRPRSSAKMVSVASIPRAGYFRASRQASRQ